MTTSTTPKSVGMFRKGALIAITIIFAITFLLSKFFLDKSIEKTIEWTAGAIHGAEVNVAKVKTQILQGELHIYGIEVTDKEQPENNLVSLRHAKFDLLIDGLLRGKIVIEDAGLRGLNLGGKRKRPGEIYKEEQTIGNDNLEKEVKNVSKIASEEMKDNFLGNLTAIASGEKAKDQLSKIKDTLASEKMIKQIESDLKTKEEQWKNTLKQIKDNQEAEKLAKEIKNTKFDKKKPFQSLKKYNELQKRVKRQLSFYKETTKNLKKDISIFKNSFKDLEKQVKKDKESLTNRFSLSSFDPKALAAVIFTKLIQEKLGENYKYIVLAKEYLPNKKKDDEVSEEKQLIPRKRGEGKTYHFPITTSYPFFWWKRGEISIDDDTTKVTGTIKNFSNRPDLLKEPATLNISGKIPKENIKQLNVEGHFDHRKEKSNDLLHVKVVGPPVAKLNLLKSDQLTFGLNKAITTWDVRSKLIGNFADFNVQGLFIQPDYNVQSESKTVKEIFSKAVTSIPNVSFKAQGRGTLQNIDWNINSPFTTQLARALKQEAKNKVKAMKDKALGDINRKLDGKKKELEAKYSKIKNSFDNLLAKEQKKVDQMLNKALKKNKVDGKKSSVEDKAKKEMKKLFKKLKF